MKVTDAVQYLDFEWIGTTKLFARNANSPIDFGMKIVNSQNIDSCPLTAEYTVNI